MIKKKKGMDWNVCVVDETFGLCVAFFWIFICLIPFLADVYIQVFGGREAPFRPYDGLWRRVSGSEWSRVTQSRKAEQPTTIESSQPSRGQRFIAVENHSVF